MTSTYDLIDRIEASAVDMSDVLKTMELVLQTLEREAKLCSEDQHDDFTSHFVPRYLDSVWYLFGQLQLHKGEIESAAAEAHRNEAREKENN